MESSKVTIMGMTDYHIGGSYGAITIEALPSGIVKISQNGNGTIYVTADELDRLGRAVLGFKKQILPIGQPTSTTVPTPALKQPKTKISGSQKMAEEKRLHKSAYQPWTSEDEGKLKILFKTGASLDEMKQQLGRNRGGIQARLKKLGLVQ